MAIGPCSSSQVYVVYMGNKNSNISSHETMLQNHQLLSTIHDGSMEKAEESHLYSYSNSFRGFAAKLTEEQASALTDMPGVVSVFPNTKRMLHTTHSWEFIGLANDEAMEIPGFSTKNQDNVIIGFIDTGIWPESPSFGDKGMPPAPSRWKGQCQNFSCNNKVIGARYYVSGYAAEEENSEQTKKSPRDSIGHGSHTASIAAGRFVSNMSYNGIGLGGAHGGAPNARIVVYKACWESGCYDADLLAAFDDAVSDGVDIISVSLGPEAPQGDYFSDAISIGSFHAAAHNILVVASAGNAGTEGSVTNVAPWMVTVGASSTDRNFVSDIVLSKRMKFTGVSLNAFGMKKSATIILAAGANAGYFTPYQASFCLESSLNETIVKGKVLVCRNSGSSSESRVTKSQVVQNAGGVGMILIDETELGVAAPFVIPAAVVGKLVGDKIIAYVNSTRGAVACISPTRTVLGTEPAPRAAAFSSKGPNSLTPEILKPDIIAPGLNILAAWSPAEKGINFNIISGTSMACPHITGLAALIKAVNPSWSPAAIKSAIMTTATVLNKNGTSLTADPGNRPANPFHYGAGFPDPSKYITPGLIYESRPSDYKSFLCSIGYDTSSLQQITGDNATCNSRPTPTASDLNYPSITVPNLKNNVTVTRVVTNVGLPKSVYRADVEMPDGVNVTVLPKYISFRRYGQMARFKVMFAAMGPARGYVFGMLTWREVGKWEGRSVRSPLVVRVAGMERGLV